ncbi:MAG: hypothetical protein FWC42_08900 [Proteobacteria bacterium]|nr:hypothetical protein [Pseudomonadota bacterium]
MFRIVTRLLFLLTLAGVVVTAHAAEECGLLPTSEVDQTFAEFAPWRTMVGGAVGSCKFLSNPHLEPGMFSFLQQFKSSKGDASSVYDAMRKGFSDAYTITEVAGFGDRAFRFAADARSNTIVAQKNKLVVTITLLLPRAVTDADFRSAIKLGQVALRGADDPEMARKASTCPWFNESGLKKLFGGKPYEVQVHGENSCMAADKQQRVLLASVMALSRGLTIGVLLGDGCQQSDLPELGKDAKLSFNCKGGNPRAEVGFEVNGLAVRLTWVARGVEPSEADKATLVELAKHARSVGAAR